MTLRRIIFLIAMSIIGVAVMRGADPLVGRWQINGGGALVDISLRPGNDGTLVMQWVDGPDLEIPAGTQVAIIYPSHTPGVYDCHAVADPRRKGVSKSKSVDFVIRFNPSLPDAIGFEAYNRQKRISLWRWIPYFFRVGIIKEDSRPSNLEGANRVCPYPKFITI